MNKKKILAGLILGAGMTLAAHAETFTFTPIRSANNATLQSLGDQLIVTVAPGTDNNVLFSFANAGSIPATITGIYFDDDPSNLLGNVTVANQTAGANFATRTGNGNLAGGSAVSFRATDRVIAATPATGENGNGLGNTGNESITLSAPLAPGATFSDVENALSGTGNDNNALRIGLRVAGITGNRIVTGTASFVNDVNGGGGSPPPPIPEPETYSMLLAGLGLMTALARRRQRRT